MAIVIPYVQQTWTDGVSSASAARMGVHEDGILNISQAPFVRVYHNVAQAITTGVLTALAFNSEYYDQAGGLASTQHDLVTNNGRLTCRYAGVYDVHGLVTWAANASGTRLMQIRINGTSVVAEDRDPVVAATDALTQSCSSHWSLAVNDYLELLVFQNSGGNLNVNSSAPISPMFSMVRVA